MAGYSWQHFYYANHDITYSNPTEDLGAKEGYTYDENETALLSVMTTVAFRYEN